MLVPTLGARCTVAFWAVKVSAGVDDHQFWWVWARQAVQNPRPQHGLLGGNIVANVQDGLGGVEVGIGAGLPIGPKRNLQRRRGRGRAQAGVAVHVGCAQARFAQHAQGVVFFQKQLATGIESDAQRLVFSLIISLERCTIRSMASSQVAVFQLTIAPN